jgi:hypothetical protein
MTLKEIDYQVRAGRLKAAVRKQLNDVGVKWYEKSCRKQKSLSDETTDN